MVTRSDWELLGRHSQVPDWARLTSSSLTELQLCLLARTFELPTQLDELRVQRGRSVLGVDERLRKLSSCAALGKHERLTLAHAPLQEPAVGLGVHELAGHHLAGDRGFAR